MAAVVSMKSAVDSFNAGKKSKRKGAQRSKELLGEDYSAQQERAAQEILSGSTAARRDSQLIIAGIRASKKGDPSSDDGNIAIGGDVTSSVFQGRLIAVLTELESLAASIGLGDAQPETDEELLKVQEISRRGNETLSAKGIVRSKEKFSPFSSPRSVKSRSDEGGDGGGETDEEDLRPWRDRAWDFFDTPSSSKGAFFYAIMIFACIGISILNFLIETTPDFWDKENQALFIIEAVVVIIFTIDYVSKLFLTRRKRWRWALEFLNQVDLWSVVPWYIELLLSLLEVGGGLGAFVVLRVLRLFRVFRILKVAKYSTLLNVVGETLKRSVPGLLLLVFSMVMAMILFGSMLFYAEQTLMSFDYDERRWYYDDDPEFSPVIQSVPDAFWWVLVTVTTVGYGDYYPRSPLGKTIGAITVVSGILVLAFPLSIIGSNFSEVWDEYKADQALDTPQVPQALDTLLQENIKSLVTKLTGEVFTIRNEIDTFKKTLQDREDRWFRMALLIEAIAVKTEGRSRIDSINSLVDKKKQSLRYEGGSVGIAAGLDNLRRVSLDRGARLKAELEKKDTKSSSTAGANKEESTVPSIKVTESAKPKKKKGKRGASPATRLKQLPGADEEQ